MPEPKAAPATLDSAFARKVRASRWALLFERLWPRLWVIIGLAGMFLLVSLVGVWPLLPDVAHLALLAAFAVAGIAALLFAVRVPFPSRDEAVRRIERVSGVPHRPASSYEDTITANADDPRTAAIWQAHRTRLAAALSRLRVGKPHPRTDRQDPIALARAPGPGRRRPAGAGRRQRVRPAALRLPLQLGSGLERGASRRVGRPALLYRTSAADAGRRLAPQRAAARG
jgi:hypothetical protein